MRACPLLQYSIISPYIFFKTDNRRWDGWDDKEGAEEEEWQQQHLRDEMQAARAREGVSIFLSPSHFFIFLLNARATVDACTTVHTHRK